MAAETDLVDLDKLREQVDSESNENYNWTYSNGRRYASTELGHYYMPNDEPEIKRLNDQHWILTQIKGGKLHNAPIQDLDNPPPTILDIGCGSGIWCIQMAEDYPNAKIIGMDVSPIQPERKPDNVEWTVNDMEKDWPFAQESFDFVHLSLVHGCVSDWDAVMQKIVNSLKPGGYIEHQEFSLCRQYTIDASGGKIPFPDSEDDLPPFLRWGRLMDRAASLRGRPIQLGPHLVTFQTSAGLDDIAETVYHLPVGTWPEDEQRRKMGGKIMLNALQGVQGFTMVLFTKVLGWEVADVQSFLEKVERDLRDDGIRKIMDMHVVYGRKPANA